MSFWFKEVVGRQSHGESNIWIGSWRKEGRNEGRKEGWIYIMRFDGGKYIPGIAKVYKQF